MDPDTFRCTRGPTFFDQAATTSFTRTEEVQIQENGQALYTSMLEARAPPKITTTMTITVALALLMEGRLKYSTHGGEYWSTGIPYCMRMLRI